MLYTTCVIEPGGGYKWPEHSGALQPSPWLSKADRCGADDARTPVRRAASRRLASPAHEIWLAEGLGGGHRCSGALLHLLGRHVLDVSGDVPAVTEGILEPPRAIAVELVLDRA